MKQLFNRTDATGYVLQGRTADGRYIYAVFGTSSRWHELALTHEQRLVFASLRKLVRLVRPGTNLYPMEARNCHGRGTIGGSTIWLPKDAQLGRELGRTIAHELVHNEGLGHGAPDWFKREAVWFTKLALATREWTVWPKAVGLRDSLSPAQRKARAAERAAERARGETATERWEKKRAHAARMLAEWEGRERRAKARARKWRSALARAERRLAQPEVQLIAARAELKEERRG